MRSPIFRPFSPVQSVPFSYEIPPRYPPAAPDGYIGNPGVAHQVVGSPTGDNEFRVEAPNIDGLGGTMIETSFFVLQGKIKAFDNTILGLVTKYYNDILGRAPESRAGEP